MYLGQYLGHALRYNFDPWFLHLYRVLFLVSQYIRNPLPFVLSVFATRHPKQKQLPSLASREGRQGRLFDRLLVDRPEAIFEVHGHGADTTSVVNLVRLS